MANTHVNDVMFEILSLGIRNTIHHPLLKDMEQRADGDLPPLLSHRSDSAHQIHEGSQKKLTNLVSKGLLPINFQPAINAVSSDDVTSGWGGPGGVVYQKGYLEVFVSPRCGSGLCM
jgi:hypothetical protein